MEFGYYLPGYARDISRPVQHLYRELIREAQWAEDLGFTSFTIPEHHFTNALMHPNALLTGIKLAEHTKHARIVTSTSILPFRDMLQLAGEIAQADCLTNGRIEVGVGRGAYKYEFARFQKDPELSHDVFRESLDLLIKLLSEEDVSYDGQFYKIPPTTIVPRPIQRPHPPVWFAAMGAGAIDYAVSLNMPVLTTPLRNPVEMVKMQAGAFKESIRTRDKPHLKISMLVMIFVTRSEEQKRRVIQDAMDRHVRFLDVFSSEGHVKGGNIAPMEPDITLEDIERNLMIGSPEEVAEKLALYYEQNIDEMQLNFSFGTPHGEIMNSIEDFMTRVVPQFQ